MVIMNKDNSDIDEGNDIIADLQQIIENFNEYTEEGIKNRIAKAIEIIKKIDDENVNLNLEIVMIKDREILERLAKND
jgi:hypothetical protein